MLLTFVGILALAIAPVARAAAAPAPAAATPAASSNPKQAAIRAGAEKLYDLSKLHRIDIVIPEADVAQVASRSEVRVRCTFTIDGVTLTDVGVRQAGGIFLPYRTIENKPSLSLKFNEFVKGQKLYGLERLVLKNQSQDLSLMNEHMAYEVFRRAGLAAPMTAYAVVTINGVLNGIYLMREPVNQDFLIRNFGDGQETGNLYEMELNWGDLVAAPDAFALKNEKEDGRSRNDIYALAAATSVAPPEYFVAAVSPLVDLDRYLTFFAVEAITSTMDGFSFHANNSYLYARPSDGRFIFIPHGADQSFWATATFVTRLGSPLQPPYSAFARKVQSVPELMAKFRAELARVSGPQIWDKAALRARVEQVGRILSTAERTGRTAVDLSLFEMNRPIILEFIEAAGTSQNGKAL